MATVTSGAVRRRASGAQSDAVLIGLAIVHAAVLLSTPSAVVIGVGLWWNANTVSHNFIHRPFFRSRAANRLFAAWLSVLLGVPQSLWRDRHLAHHAGVPARLRVSGELAFEAALVSMLWVAMAARAPMFLATVYVPGYVLGLILCHLHGYYEHARGATSHYGKAYNLLLFNDGYHVEHHARPGVHWTRLPACRSREGRTSRWPAPLRWMEELSPGARLSNAGRAPGRRATRAVMLRIIGVLAGQAGLPGACSRFSDTLVTKFRLKPPRDERAAGSESSLLGGRFAAAKTASKASPETCFISPEQGFRRCLEGLERIVLRSPFLQDFVLRTHTSAFRRLIATLPPIARVTIVGGGLYPRTAFVVRSLLPDARITIVDADRANLECARELLGESTIEFAHERYRAPERDACDLLIVPLAFDGDRSAIYARPPANAVLVHDWIWRRRGVGCVVSIALLKRINLVRR